MLSRELDVRDDGSSYDITELRFPLCFCELALPVTLLRSIFAVFFQCPSSVGKDCLCNGRGAPYPRECAPDTR